jgi:Putative transposase of IS4/5 family (DUF4096)
MGKSRGIRGTYLTFQPITRAPRGGCSEPSGVRPVNLGLRARPSRHISSPASASASALVSRRLRLRLAARGLKGRLGPGFGFASRRLVNGRLGGSKAPGRKRLDDRKVLCGISFVLYTGIPWEFLPQELGFGSGMTC